MRSRNLKPGFFKNADLAELPFEGRLLFAGLWCLADREGRLQDRPKQIRGELFPYDLTMDVNELLDLLAPRFLVRYLAADQGFIQIKNFHKHQQPHYKESPSQIPAPPNHTDSLYLGGGVPESMRLAVIEEEGQCALCGTKRDLTIDHKTPRSMGGTNDRSNLQALCRKCNSSKNNRIVEQSNLDPTLTQDRLKVGSTKVLHDPLTPSSLTPDSPILTAESTTHSSPKPAGDAPAGPSFGPDDLMNLWNEKAHPNLGRVKLLPKSRETHVKARLRDFPDELWWVQLIEKINESTFLTGRSRPRNGSDKAFAASFDWILSTGNITKIIEGNYDDELVRR